MRLTKFFGSIMIYIFIKAKNLVNWKFWFSESQMVESKSKSKSKSLNFFDSINQIDFCRKVELINQFFNSVFEFSSLVFRLWFLCSLFSSRMFAQLGRYCMGWRWKKLKIYTLGQRMLGIESCWCNVFVQHPLKQNKIGRAYRICEELRHITCPKLLKGLLYVSVIGCVSLPSPVPSPKNKCAN